MRLSDKMTQTRHNLDEVYENLGDGITSALNKMFEYGVEAERQRIIKLLENDPEDIIPSGGGLRAGYETAITLIKGEK